MLRALSSGVTGLKTNQEALDVIGNNIANINTTGYKAARTEFADLMSQTLSPAQAPGNGASGRDPMQIGLGSSLAAISTVFTQGTVQSTGNATDLAIQGDGMFVLADGNERYYSRAGGLTLDAAGTLVDTVTGYHVQGLSGDITIPTGAMTAGQATATATFGGNLDTAVADGTTHVMTFSVNDSLGNAHGLTLTFTKNFAGPAPVPPAVAPPAGAAGAWDWAVTTSDPGIASMAVGGGAAAGRVVFGTDGQISAGSTAALALTFGASLGNLTPQTVTLDFGSASNGAPMTGFAGASTGALTNQDGYVAGALRSFGITSDGSVVGNYDNGRTQTLAQLQLATFINPGGLSREGQNVFRETVNSGTPNIGNPGTGGRGTLLPGSIEGSNVDLAHEFTELITAQRGFEANARMIRTGDDILQTVVNIKQ